MKYNFKKNLHFVYPLGKPMPPHLQRCQGLAVADYNFTLGRLEAGAPSAFAHLGFTFSFIHLSKVATTMYHCQMNLFVPVVTKRHIASLPESSSAYSS
jgi:hypothetical protein